MQACEHLKENLTLYAYGELDPVAEREVANHLKICEGCRAEHKRLLTVLTKVRDASLAPQLSPLQARAMASDIKRKLNVGHRRAWWRRYLEFKPSRLIPAAAVACAVVLTVAVIGYLNLDGTPGTEPVALNQNEELMLSDKDLEILDNLELLKEMDAIQKLSRVVDSNDEFDSQRSLENGTRGMRRDGLANYSV